MSVRQFLIACAILSVSRLAFAQDATQPLKLYGGVQENNFVPLSPERQAQQAQQAADDARRTAEAQRWRDVSTFLENPRVYRVTQVDSVKAGQGLQRIHALAIHTVKVNQNGKVDLGEIVEGSGDSFEIPPGTCKVGELIAFDQGQVVEVPKDHFDLLGGLAAVGKQQVPLSPTTVLLNAANEMDRVATQAENNAMAAANHFTSGVAKWAKNTFEFLSQQRGDFGRPGKPAQALLDYLNNDHNENDQKLYEGAVAALDQLQKDPAAFWGEQGPGLIPLGELGKEAEVGRMMQAAKNISKVQNTADEFAAFENAASSAARVDRAAAKKAEESVQRAQQASAQQRGGAPGAQPSAQGSPPRQPPAVQTSSPVRQQPPQPRAQAQLPPQEQQRLPSPAQQQGAPPAAGASQRIAGSNAPPSRSATPPSPPGPPGPPAKSPPSPARITDPVTGDPTQMNSQPVPMTGDTVQPSAVPDPMKGEAAPLAQGADPALAPQNTPAPDVIQTAAGDNTLGKNPAVNAQPDQWKPVVGGKIVPSPPSPSARGLPELNPLLNIDPDLKNCIQTAMAQDTAWATGQKAIALPLEATSPPGTAITGTSREDIMSLFKNKFGSSPKDPLHGDVGLLAHRQGIPVPSSRSEIVRALSTAKGDSRGIAMIERSDGTAHAFNARYNNGQVEFWDAQVDAPADFSNATRTWFYRTN